LLATDWFYGADHDLVVNTGSMYGGIRRSEGGARFQRDQGPEVSHFHYFANDTSVRWLQAGLTRADDGDGGFQPIQAAPHEAPKWREAIRRSRAIAAPRPLAVVLPGTLGSALQADDKDIWLDYLALFTGGLGRLRMGKAMVRPTDVLDDFYGPLIEFLARSHRVEVFPYDWRLSVRDAAAKLAAKLEDWLPEIERQRQPVHLVAHSMGGLVVRAMIADGGRGTAVWRRILDLPNSRFMMLGTPNLGSHEAVRWLTGHNPTQAKLSLLDITHDTDEIIGIVNRFPGLLELLPFDPKGADFSQPTLWRNLHEQLFARWEAAESQDLIQARTTWDFLKQAPPDPERMIYVAGCQNATVVDYRVVDYEEDWLIGRKRLEFIATREGDGTVAWRSGLLPGVETWYVQDTAHDELCTKRRAFPGYLDLLMTGTTTRLPATPPGRARATAGEPERFVLPASPPTDQIPDAAGLRGFGFGISRPFDENRAGRGVPPIRISLLHGSLAYARHPVLVGHYLGDTIVSAELELDRRLGGALSQRQRLGLYPGQSGTHALFFNPKRGGEPGGAAVIGLGQVGELTPGLLIKGVRDAMLDYALRIAQWPDDRFGHDEQVRSAALSCLLVGSGAGGMAVRDSVDAILRGALAANEKLVAAQLEGQVLIDRIELLELFEDVAIRAAQALRSVLSDGQLAMQVIWPEAIVEEGEGQLSRVGCDEAPNWWQRLEIIEDKRAETLRFIATTDRARAEETLATGQLRLADDFIHQASQSAGANAEVAKTLFEMLLPNRLKELAPTQADLVLLVDERSARYPWELLEDRWSHGKRPPAVAAGLVRQLKTPQFRPHPAHATEATAFVVGNPDLAGWDLFSDLPGARREAQKVAALLNTGGYRALECIDVKAGDILSGLHRSAWRILHLAGHGEHEIELDAFAKPVSGMVIGRESFLTPGDVQQMRWVPELVFINCCHLGKTLSTTATRGHLGMLAANLAVEFVQMGVKAVVAAGWAVDDGAAEAFAASFYDHMLGGESFGRAVRAAREEIWVRFPDVNTWGAYQCYGDPAYRLHNEGDQADTGTAKPYHAPAELVSDLNNDANTIRMQVKKRGEDPDALEAMRSGITDRLTRIPDKAHDDWLARADVAAALGFALGESGAYAEAIDWLEKAIRAEKGDCPVRAVEQCANFRVRLSGQRWLELRARADAVGSKARRSALIDEILEAIRELDLIGRRAPTMERYNLLGGSCKRLAWLQNDATPRLEALVNMGNYYRQAYELGKEKGEENPYPFTNWAVAKLLAWWLDPAQDGNWRHSLESDCRNMIQIAQERNEKKPNFWDAVGSADCELVLLLQQADLKSEEAGQAAARIAEMYRSASQRGASPREYASVKEHLDFVISLSRDMGSPLVTALDTLRAKL
ncbi:MAG: CHAT domain-containing protein, partial [Chromatiaceae bacterium]|nr:CHAT domain-containing protein [Chromatiaceae bacterium]